MKNTKILFIAGSDFTIHPNHRAHHFVRYLEQTASRVDIISLRRFYSGEDKQNTWNRFKMGIKERGGKSTEILEREKGIQILIRRLPGRLDFIMQDFWAATQLQAIKAQTYDLCIYGNPDNAYLPVSLSLRNQVKNIVYDDWDYYPGFDHTRILNQIIQAREKWCASSADLVISVGELLAQLRSKQGAKSTIAIPNGVNYTIFSAAQKKKPHPPTLVYMGKLAEEYGVDVSIRGFKTVCQEIPNARYLIIGYNQDEYAQHLQDLTSQYGLQDHIHFVGGQPYEKLPNFLDEADVGVALFKPNDLMKYAFPLKVVEYMAAGLAVIGTRIGETETLIDNSEAGYAVEYDAADFAEKTIRLLKNTEQLNSFSEKAASYARQFDWQALFDKLTQSEAWRSLGVNL